MDSINMIYYGMRPNSTAVTKTYHIDKVTESNYGVIVGGSIGAVTVILIGVTVILCKVRNKYGVKTQQHVNQGYALVNQGREKTNKTNNSYAQVQKVKRTKDTYAESTNGEYDHLHNIDGRKLNTSENTYDSNTGVRNRNDPTYDTATSSTRVDMDNTYDHSFLNMKTTSEYDVSDPSMQIDRTNYDAYDQAC
ncbi:unnamed protein product [Mytilus coruscus]|uniref:Uncharacterized protein n=1 Tax=Mytilus coruscus TaxID=42192 RepID=A0A6J8BKR9_MYTCO|nr:unnamed protein product [Mytilus coruscus]